MRIISGIYKGKEIKTPEVKTTHPMGSREKLALMNMLAPYLDGADVLDLFAGSGALGLEALSRGAKTVTFVENNPEALKTIRENIKNLGSSQCRAEASIPPQTPRYNVIIADPPYDNFQLPDVENLLEENGIFALSHPSTFDPKTAEPLKPLTFLKTSHYAACNISLFAK